VKDYEPEFFAMHEAGARHSAAAVVPYVMARYPNVSTVLDIGCGRGFWGAEFARARCDVLGIDGATEHPVISLFAYDLTSPLPVAFLSADLIVCLEVAEHLPPERAETFVAELCAMAPLILWSAAIPGQGGHHHVNLQPVSWWAALFHDHGYYLDDSIRRHFWDDARIEPWYRQNMMMASREEAPVPENLRHPEL
jgi:SAM-dependent methyltransferase